MPFKNKDLRCVGATHNCKRCHKTFLGIDSKESLIQHLRAKHRSPYVPETCVHCRRRFSNTKAFIQHLQNNQHHQKDLHHAACTGKFQLVDQLMRNESAKVPGESHTECSKSQTGYTPMHCAAFGGHYECLKIMLSWPDGDPNVIDPEDGRTPVHLAAWKGHGNCLKLLLRKGGDVCLEDYNGDTPISLTKDDYCFSLIFFHMAEKQSWLRSRGYPSSEQELDSVKQVWDRLQGENSSEQQSRVHPRTGQLEVINEDNQATCQGHQIALNNKEPYSEPYEVLARGEVAVGIFKKALLEGKAKVTRMQLTVIGDIGAGKTSLVRNLSGEEFVEERIETHGIDTSMVELTELDDEWHVADPDKSHVDEILSDKVCQGIKNTPEGQRHNSQVLPLRSSSPEPSLSAEKSRPSGTRRLLSIEYAPTFAEADDSVQTSMIPVTRAASWPSGSSNELTYPRDMPVDQITRKLSKTSFDEKERKYAKISIWDFAGHPLYQAMHHVFLNRRSFYLAVTNLAQLCNSESREQALTELHFWLNSVRVHTPQTTPIFLVGTRRDNVSQQDISNIEKVLYDEFAKTFGQQLVRSREKSFLFAVENTLGCEDNAAVLLKKAIGEEASRLMLDEELPVLWLHFEEEILKCRERPDCPACVPKASLKEMVERNFRVVDEITFDSMLHFYHDSGVIILPEELIGPETQNAQINNLVVINPQYLVDVMTCLHDISEHLDVDRQHRSQWTTLQDDGIADINLLEHVWKGFDSPATQLVAILEACGMLCPISTSAENEDPEKRGDKEQSEELVNPEISKYIIPFHLKKKSIRGKWERRCRKDWDGICNSDKVLVFDFHTFLPPALFHYFIVRTGAKSKASNGMRPIIAKEMAIFSFGDSYFILTESCQKYRQIKISARYKNDKKLHELFSILMSIMTDICQRHFKFLKFSFGPFCPNPRCPGAAYDGKVLPLDSSSDESDEEADGNSTCDEADDGHPRGDGRRHVICIDPAVPSRPLWCNSTPVHKFEEIKEWFKLQNTVLKVPGDSPCHQSMQIKVCCLALVAKAMANNWKWLGRFLDVPDVTIDNIEIDYKSQDERSYQVLRTWSQKNGSNATVYSLMKAMQEVENGEAMEAFDRHLDERHGEETST